MTPPTLLQRGVIAALLTTALAIPVLGANGAPARVLPAYRAVPGSVTALPSTTQLGSLAPTRQLRLAIGLASRDSVGLNRALAAVEDPRSSSYHHYLTPAAYARRFGPDPRAVQSLSGWLTGQGLRVQPWHGGVALSVQGSVVGIERAFQIHLARYQLPANVTPAGTSLAMAGHAGTGIRPESRFAPDRAPLLPAALAGSVLGISGLDDVIRPRSAGDLTIGTPGSTDAVDPSRILSAYDFNPLYNAGYHGEGTSIDLVEFAPYDPADIATFLTHYGLQAPKLVDHAIDGGAADQPSSVDPTLAIEELAAAAPGATIHVYSAPGTGSAAAVLDTYSAIAQAHDAQVVSLTWGTCEPLATGDLSSFAASTHAALKQMALEGMTVVAATGDGGAYGCGIIASPAGLQSQVAVSLPSSDPYVTAVGATTLTLSAQNTITSEVAWSCSPASGRCGNGAGPHGYGSGGGISTLFSTGDSYGSDLSWQKGSGVYNSYSTGGRQVPDVAFSGSDTDGVDKAILFYYQASWQGGGGTSAGAPMWAALFALANQYLAGHGQPALGWANQQIYQLAGDTGSASLFHDIQQGDNLYYQATPGWDYATGWGSPNAFNLVQALAGSAAVTTATATAIPTQQPSDTPLPPTTTPSIGTSPVITSPTSTPTIAPTSTPRVALSVTPVAANVPAGQATLCLAPGIDNGGFEAGNLACWETSGTLPPRVTTIQRHAGRFSVSLGSVTPPSRSTTSVLRQSFVLLGSGAHPALHLNYWVARTPAICTVAASCPRPAVVVPRVRVLDLAGKTLATAVLSPTHERTWSEFILPFPAGGPYTLEIQLPAQPARTALQLYLDDLRVTS